MKVTLIINGKTADLSEDGLILMTYQASDAEQPAAVKNSYSQSVTLPSTPANDAIFSHILRSDFKTTTGRFDVLARTPFEIRNERQEILVSGYLKLNGGVPGTSYDVSLFGGLGGFFYSLKYNSDGTERTLADLAWPAYDYTRSQVAAYIDADDTEWADEANLSFYPSGFAARYNGTFDEYLPVQFAPLNDGVPDDFDANKAYYKYDAANDENFEEIRPARGITDTSGTVTWYYPKNGQGNGIIAEFGSDHNGWEMQEFRVTHQRPLWSIRSFLLAIQQSANNGGYTVEIDSTFMSSPFVQKGWVTLKCDYEGEIVNNWLPSLEPLLRDTATPADYLLSIAKLCGLMFLYDEQAKKVQVLTRNSYYREYYASRINLEGLIAKNKGRTITPLLMSDKWQVLSAEAYGAKAEDYEERKGRQYGSLWVNTGYEFGGNENEVLSSSVFKGAADVMDTNINYRVLGRSADATTLDIIAYWLKFGLTDEIKFNLYTQGSDQSSKSFEPNFDTLGLTPILEKGYGSADFDCFTTLPQLRDADGQREDGNDVLLFFAGRQALPSGTSGGYRYAVKCYATDTPAEMLELNGDKPCWNLTHLAANRVNYFPVFRRQLEGTEDWSMQFARPSEFYTDDTDYVSAIAAADYLGARCWKSWLEERCHADVRKMKCWVNLRTAATPKVDADLLRRFWYYEGAVWVLDKISGHSLTTDDLTECEFVKVRDITKYANGQDWEAVLLTESGGDYLTTSDGEYLQVIG